MMMRLKLAFRTLFKTPFVTIVAVVSLVLGIGANTAIFSWIRYRRSDTNRAPDGR